MTHVSRHCGTTWHKYGIGWSILAYVGGHWLSQCITSDVYMMVTAPGVCGNQHTLTSIARGISKAGIIVRCCGRGIQIGGMHSLMVVYGMMFGKIVSLVGVAWLLKDMKLTLPFVVMEPIEAHANGFGLFLLDSVIEDSTGGVVVSLQGCDRLGVT